jgi:hypothetical protein
METDNLTILHNLMLKLRDEYQNGTGFELFLDNNSKLVMQIHTSHQKSGNWTTTLLYITTEKGIIYLDFLGVNEIFEYNLCDPTSFDEVFEKIRFFIPQNPKECVDKLLQSWSAKFLGVKLQDVNKFTL